MPAIRDTSDETIIQRQFAEEMTLSRSWPAFLIPIALCMQLTFQIATADQKESSEALLSEIVSATVRTMRSNGYEMPDYRVNSGGTDVPISGPAEKYAFFGYSEKGRPQEKSAITLHFYEADHLPLEGRRELISHLVTLHAKRHGDFTLSLRMMKSKYKKGQIVLPEAFLEMKLGRIEG